MQNRETSDPQITPVKWKDYDFNGQAQIFAD